MNVLIMNGTYLLCKAGSGNEVIINHIILGEKGKALSRSGQVLCDAEVLQVKSSPAFDKTHLLTMKVPNDFADTARVWKRG